MSDPARLQNRYAGGFTMVEFVVVGIVVAILAGTLLHRLSIYREQADRAAATRTLAILRTALSIQVALVSGKGGNAAVLAGQNPMRWLARAPLNYVGELSLPKPGAVPERHWYFDRKRHLLVYLLNNPKKFPQGITNTLQYEVKLIRRNNSFAQPTRTSAQSSLALIQVDG